MDTCLAMSKDQIRNARLYCRVAMLYSVGANAARGLPRSAGRTLMAKSGEFAEANLSVKYWKDRAVPISGCPVVSWFRA